MMRNKISEAFPKTRSGSTASRTIFIADFTERTNGVKGVEVVDEQPMDPNDGSVEMDCCIVKNSEGMPVVYCIFHDAQFRDDEGALLKHGECCLFPWENDEKSWVLIIEIKDCKRSRISKYKKNVKEKSIKTVEEFKRRKIITDNNVYCIASFPRKKTDFNEMIVTDPTEYKRFYKEYGFRFVPTNEVSIKDDTIIEFYKKR